jgi:hypothetical protein
MDSNFTSFYYLHVRAITRSLMDLLRSGPQDGGCLRLFVGQTGAGARFDARRIPLRHSKFILTNEAPTYA